MSPSLDVAPLARFRTAEQLAALDLVAVPAAGLSPDARRLLVHAGDMTSRLERFHEEALSVQALRVLPPMAKEPDIYSREVLLETRTTRKPVEYGGIDIHLNAAPALREAILEADTPLGALLEKAGHTMSSCPAAFFTARADEYLAALLQVAPGARLHGRRNTLRIDGDALIAEIVEIVPQ